MLTNGIPQGSHLASILFIIFINNIVDVTKNSQIWLYLNDIKIALEIVTPDDCKKLQKDLDNIREWCIRNGMKLNISKCAAISFRKSNFSKFFKYYLINQKLERVNSIKDPGIIFDSVLSFNEHINKIIIKANKMWAFIWRNTKHFMKWQSIRVIYLTLVRLILLYGSIRLLQARKTYLARAFHKVVSRGSIS